MRKLKGGGVLRKCVMGTGLGFGKHKEIVGNV